MVLVGDFRLVFLTASLQSGVYLDKPSVVDLSGIKQFNRLYSRLHFFRVGHLKYFQGSSLETQYPLGSFCKLPLCSKIKLMKFIVAYSSRL